MYYVINKDTKEVVAESELLLDVYVFLMQADLEVLKKLKIVKEIDVEVVEK